jgi:hypothetical protein
MPLLNCGNSSKLALYFVLNLAIRMFRHFPGRKSSDSVARHLPAYTLHIKDAGTGVPAQTPP